MNDRPAFGLDTVLPAWEANYEPGNVSDYLIGYANDEAAAKAAAIAWLTSQSDKDPASLEWIDVPTGTDHDHWYDLIQNHDDGIPTDTGINVRHRLPAAIRDTARTASGQQPETTPHVHRLGNPDDDGLMDDWDNCRDPECPGPSAQEREAALAKRASAAPAVGQPAEAQATDEVCPPHEQWRIQVYDAGKWNSLTGPMASIESAAARRRSIDMPTRVVRETTTWTVEDETR